MYVIFICCINSCLRRGQRYLELVLVLALARADNTEISTDLVVALRSPRHIMHIAKLIPFVGRAQ